MFEPFVLELIAQAGSPEFIVQSGIVFIECSSISKFKPIHMMFNNYWITVTPENFFWDVVGDGRTCILLAMANSYEFFLIGEPLFQGYYTHHDMLDKTISYGPLKNSGMPGLVLGTVPTTMISEAG